MTEEVRVFRVHDVFVRNKRTKPFHVEVVHIKSFGVLCKNGRLGHDECGLYWAAPDESDPSKPNYAEPCPDCGQIPPPARFSSEAEVIEIAVRIAFGNILGTEFLRSIGPLRVTQRQVSFGYAPATESQGHVHH